MHPGQIVTPKHAEHNRYGTVATVRAVYGAELVLEIRGRAGLVIAVLVENSELWRLA